MKSERRGKFGERKEKVLIFALLFVTLAFLSVSVGCASAATTIYVPEGGNQTIQQAVNNATEGDTIIVKDGTYTENVNVNVNHLTIQSENGSASTIVQAAIPDDHVFEITANHVKLSGFTVENATQGAAPTYTAGIYLYYVDHCNISDNTVSNNFCGIWLNSSNNNIISNNNASSNMDTSIVLVSSNNNTIYNNTASSNIGVYYPDDGHVYSWGIYLWGSSNNITANIANSNAGDLSWGIYIEATSNNNILADNNCSNNVFGVYLTSSSNNTLTDNNCSNNAHGIYLYSSSNFNTLTNNTASNSIAYDFYSGENSHSNTVGNLMISSHPTTISFTYGQGIGLKGVTTPNSDPPGKVNIGKFMIVTNETANSWIFLNVSYSDADITSVQESTLKMWKYNGTTWTEVPSPNGVNTDENYVYANITSFSIFAPLGNSDGYPCGDICVNESGWWCDSAHFNASNTPIQHAIDNATAGNTICMKDGNYNENVDVNKQLTIQSENGSASTIVNASDSNDYVFNVTADYVNINGFTVKDATQGVTHYTAGIYLYYADYCNISDNTLANNFLGIWLNYSNNNIISNNNASSNMDTGIVLLSSNNNSIYNNTASSNNMGAGIYIESSSYNMLTNNTANLNNDSGISVQDSSNNTITSNTANSNTQSHGISLWVSYNNTVINNTANENNEGGICLDYSNNNTLTDNTANENNHSGIQLLQESCNNTVTNNTVNLNHDSGICLESSSSNTITGNAANDNHDNGIRLDYSSDNTLNNNIANSNKRYGIYFYSSSNNNIITNNTANNNSGEVDSKGIVLEESSNNTLTNNVANGNSEIGIWLYDNAHNNVLINNIATFNLVGIWLEVNAHNNTLTNNTANNNMETGISLNGSPSNNITGNTVSNNEAGIHISNSSSNTIYNNYFDNTNNVDSSNSINIWNTTKTPGENIVGGNYIGGNYWSDYEGTDTDGDGLGDTPYDISGGINKDYLPLVSVFDTGKGTYPSIMGVHNGTINPSSNIYVHKIYTYPCTGTGGHTEYVKIWDEDTSWNVTATWKGYVEDWHNITFDSPFTLEAGKTYNYEIRTGSYPQIIHESSKEVTGGTITCTSFVDANGKTYTDWIPAIKME